MPNGEKFTWHGAALQRGANDGLLRNMSTAMEEFRKEVKAVVSVSGRTAEYITSKKTGKVRKILGAYGSSPSEPGDPPHKQTGELFRAIKRKVYPIKKAVRVFARDPKAGLLEFGTSKMAARPYMRTTFARMLNRIREVVAKPVNINVSGYTPQS